MKPPVCHKRAILPWCRTRLTRLKGFSVSYGMPQSSVTLSSEASGMQCRTLKHPRLAWQFCTQTRNSDPSTSFATKRSLIRMQSAKVKKRCRLQHGSLLACFAPGSKPLMDSLEQSRTNDVGMAADAETAGMSRPHRLYEKLSACRSSHPGLPRQPGKPARPLTPQDNPDFTAVVVAHLRQTAAVEWQGAWRDCAHAMAPAVGQGRLAVIGMLLKHAIRRRRWLLFFISCLSQLVLQQITDQTKLPCNIEGPASSVLA